MRKIEVQDRTDLIRDENSNAILSTDLNAYNARKQLMKKEHDKNIELNNLRNELNSLRDMVTKLLERDNA